MKIYYGIINNFVDVTDICLLRLTNNNIITIPKGDSNRSIYFFDHLVGIHKKILVTHEDVFQEFEDVSQEFDENVQIKINILNNKIETNQTDDDTDENNHEKEIANSKISEIHSKLKIKYGSLNDELPEQKMAVRFLDKNSKVLEIGGNIGRNSLVISSILDNDQNLVTLESDSEIAQQLTENRDLNNLNFHVENSALSKRKLIQNGWITIPSDILQDDYKWVNTISFDELKNKYNIEFDALVLDCEGAFYYILLDMPEILHNIKMIIMENDYTDISHKNYIDGVLVKNNFNRVYVESGGWGPCYDKFFEVWKR